MLSYALFHCRPNTASLALVSTRASFRFRDALRLGAYYLVTRPVVSLGVVGIVLLAAVVVVASFDAVLVLLLWLLTLGVHVVTRPVASHLMETFVTD